MRLEPAGPVRQALVQRVAVRCARALGPFRARPAARRQTTICPSMSFDLPKKDLSNQPTAVMWSARWESSHVSNFLSTDKRVASTIEPVGWIDQVGGDQCRTIFRARIASPMAAPTATSSTSSPGVARERMPAISSSAIRLAIGAPQRGGDGGLLRGAGDPGDHEGEQWDRGSPDDRPFAAERAHERVGGEALPLGQTAPEDARVSVGEPVERGCDHGRGNGVEVALVTSALGRQQRSDQDESVDQPRGVLGGDPVARSRHPPARRRGRRGERRLRRSVGGAGCSISGLSAGAQRMRMGAL